MLNKFAKILSAATHPYLTPLYLVLILLGTDSVYSLFPPKVKLYLIWVVILYTLILPIITRGALHFIGRKKQYDILSRHAHITSLLASSCCYMLCAITFMRSPALELFHKMALAAFVTTILLLVSSKWIKPSAHIAAFGVGVIFLAFLNIIGVESFLKYLLATILLSGVVASTHLYLGKETPAQLALGFAEGIAACVIAILIL